MAKENTYTIDDSVVYNTIDETLANLDITILEKARQESIKAGESTEILDKAIDERKKRDRLIKEEKSLNKIIGLLGFISGLFQKKPKSSTMIEDKEYEPYNFEEEELEEDDYHYDDLD